MQTAECSRQATAIAELPYIHVWPIRREPPTRSPSPQIRYQLAQGRAFISEVLRNEEMASSKWMKTSTESSSAYRIGEFNSSSFDSSSDPHVRVIVSVTQQVLFGATAYSSSELEVTGWLKARLQLPHDNPG